MAELEGTKKFIYFPGLNGLRFIAAFLVILQHIEHYKSSLGFDKFICDSFIFQLGDLSVTFFFVLSGYLITFLLLTEKIEYGTISIKNFYIKRILRIWPPYYLTVIIGLFVLPKIAVFDNVAYAELYNNFGIKVLLFMLFFPNIVLVKYGVIPFVAPTWSVGVEEQFYLIWPWFLKYFKKYLFILILVVIAGSLLIKIPYYLSLHTTNVNTIKWLDFIKSFFIYFRIGAMAIGGIGAYLVVFKKDAILNFIYRIDFQIFINLSLLFCLYKGLIVRFLHPELYSIMFCIIILNVSTNPKSLYKLENKVLNFLGKISFGLYLYHAPLVFLSIRLFAPFLFQEFNYFWGNILLYSISLALSILVSYLSYQLMEKRFLNLKEKFQKIRSSNKLISNS